METSKINWQPIHLEDDRVKLVPLTESDFDRLYAVASDPLLWQQHPAKSRFQREVFQLFFEGALASGTSFLIVDKVSGTVIGSTRYYDYQAKQSAVGIGFTFLAIPYWGGPYNRSAKTMLLGYAFQYVDKVFFHIGATNIRSQVAISRLGAIKTEEVEFEVEGKKLPHYVYVIEKQEWGK